MNAKLEQATAAITTNQPTTLVNPAAKAAEKTAKELKLAPPAKNKGQVFTATKAKNPVVITANAFPTNCHEDDFSTLLMSAFAFNVSK